MLSAMVVSFLREMDIDTELFSLTTLAGRDELLEPSREKLKALRVVNDGFEEPKWTIESSSGLLYLKGERDTEHGINKFILLCDRKIGVMLHVIFDPQGRNEEVVRLPAHSLVINDNDAPISPVGVEMKNGWFNAHYSLSPKQVRELRNATSVGLIVRHSYKAPIFLGFNHLPFEDGARKLNGILNSCRYSGR
jgi:hypothetical protein